MKRLLAAAAAALLTLTVVPAQSAKGTVAVVPAHVLKGPPENGNAVKEALTASLAKHGLTLLPDDRVEAAMKTVEMDPAKIQDLQSLAALRKAAGADYVVYPRVLSVGIGINAKGEHQVSILVNVMGSNPRAFVHTRQIGQVFESETTDKAVLDDEKAAEAAATLLEGFYAKVK